jgi:hypothetical protein
VPVVPATLEAELGDCLSQGAKAILAWHTVRCCLKIMKKIFLGKDFVHPVHTRLQSLHET